MRAQPVFSQSAIARLEDLPYWSSPPIQFVYESQANLALGNYVWADTPGVFTPNRPIRENVLYFFRNISLSADIAEVDFTSNIVTTPQFYTFRESDTQAVLFREPIQMVKFFEDFAYRFAWETHRVDDILYGAFTGSLVQGPGLIGKASITLKAIISAQEIVDDNFINLFKAHYPSTPDSVREAHHEQ